MALHEVRVPHLDTYNFGVGIDRLSGMAMNQVVNATQSPPLEAGGASQSFEVSRVSSTHDLEEKLGIDVNASYGCASFGAGVSARFSFAQNSEVHSASLFMTISASVHFADLSIADCVLTPTAAQVVDRQDIFAGRYGDMFARACKRGGLFVGVMRVETFDETQSTNIEAELRGSYGMFSGDAETNFSKITRDHKASVYCKVYTEGGPALQLDDPNDPVQLIVAVKLWLKAMYDDSEKYAQPYQWTLSPVSIAEGPMPPNQADIEHAQDVLKFCAQERATLLDQLNLLNWWSRHQDYYDWTGAGTPQQIGDAAKATEIDLDTVARCASAAINSPTHALMPTEYAVAQTPPKAYPSSLPLPIGPKPKPGAVPPIQTPNLMSLPFEAANAIVEKLGLRLHDESPATIAVGDQALMALITMRAIFHQDPPPDSPIMPGGTIKVSRQP
jgi:hypothetical protein